MLRKQGIDGPPPSFLLGNIPDMKRIKLKVQGATTTTPKENHNNVVPIAHDWRKEYGPVFLFSFGSIQLLCLTDTEIVKEISLCTSLSLGKPPYLVKDRGALVGQGIVSSSSPIWAHQRKIIAPEFYTDKVKGMQNLMVECTTSMLRSWESRIENEGGIAVIEIDKDLRSLSADIISRACFGSNYTQGEEIFLKLRTLEKIMSKRPLGIPWLRFLPSKMNIQIWKLEKEINSMIVKVVKQWMETSYEKDLLQMLLGAKNSGEYNSLCSDSDISCDKFVVDNCKNIYIAGHETVALTASWCLMLLAAYLEWQDQARAEVLEICKDGIPDADMLRSMKTLAMVIRETLCLYPALPVVTRAALQDIKFKDSLIPKGMNVWVPVAMLQQHPDIWGPDAHEFTPERFAQGVTGACKIPQAFIPFGLGACICVGQHSAMTQLKLILSLTLSKFCLSLSPTYQHSPAYGVLLQPQHGIPLHVKRV